MKKAQPDTCTEKARTGTHIKSWARGVGWARATYFLGKSTIQQNTLNFVKLVNRYEGKTRLDSRTNGFGPCLDRLFKISGPTNQVGYVWAKLVQAQDTWTRHKSQSGQVLHPSLLCSLY